MLPPWYPTASGECKRINVINPPVTTTVLPGIWSLLFLHRTKELVVVLELGSVPIGFMLLPGSSERVAQRMNWACKRKVNWVPWDAISFKDLRSTWAIGMF
jgi:hypothetical protein